MSLILRNVKGSALTYNEGDANLLYLESLFTGGTSATTLQNTLVAGNTTGGNNIVTSDGDTIEAASGLGQLDLRYGATDNEVMLSTDAGAWGVGTNLYLSDSYTELAMYSAVGNPAITLFTNEAQMLINNNAAILLTYLPDNANVAAMGMSVGGIGGGQTGYEAGIKSPGMTMKVWSINSHDNTTFAQGTGNVDIFPVSISARGSVIGAGLKNVAIIGGTGISATASNTVYVPDLVIQANKGLQFGAGPKRVMFSTAEITWDMDANASSPLIAHGLSATEWLTIVDINAQVKVGTSSIRSLSGDKNYVNINIAEIQASRENAGSFDNATYNAAKLVVTFWYTPD